MTDSSKKLVNFFFELGLMKKFEHCGTKFAGIKHPDSLADHTARAAQIGLMLAFCEGGNAEHVSLMCVFHDIGEIRVGDAHRIAMRYIKMQPGEQHAMMEQTEPLPPEIREKIRNLWNEFHEQKTKDSHIARDADLLETMFEAKEHVDNGYKAAQRWLENGSKVLKTKSAKALYKRMTTTHFAEWWDELNVA